METPNAVQERILARTVYEYAALIAVQEDDTDSFQRYVSSLRPYYAGYGYNMPSCSARVCSLS